MPELAEVLYFSRRWAPALDQKILRVHLHDQKRVLRGVRTGQMRSTLRDSPCGPSKPTENRCFSVSVPTGGWASTLG